MQARWIIVILIVIALVGGGAYVVTQRLHAQPTATTNQGQQANVTTPTAKTSTQVQQNTDFEGVTPVQEQVIVSTDTVQDLQTTVSLYYPPGESPPEGQPPSIEVSRAGSGSNEAADNATFVPNPSAVAPPETVGDGSADPDSDGLTNDQELTLGTNPNVTDTDGDGLNDGEEVRQYRTDSNKADTDGDGLTDGQEVQKYHTDPLNPDTDHDGYQDGAEVKGGYNPKGPGKL